MIFQGMLIKQSSIKEIKIINLFNTDEAILDDETYELLKSIFSKENREDLSEKENELLNFLIESLDLKVINGLWKPIVRLGDFEGLEVYLTNTCNLRCKHCYFFGEGKHTESKFINFDLLVKTIIDAEKMGFYKIKLCGGEPLMYYRMKELFSFLSLRDISTTVISNGTLLDNFLDELDNSKLSFVISLDGFEHSHDYLRGNGSFGRTVNNIEKAVKLGFDVSINMVVYDRNVNDIDKFTEFVKGIGVSGLNIQVVRPVGMAAENLNDNIVTDESFLRKIHQNELESQSQKIESGESFCTSCKTGLTVDFDHNVIGCPFFSEETIGNLNKENLHEIHQRSLLEDPFLYVKEKAECVSCKLFKVVCAGGCRARAKKMTGSIYGCDYWIPFLLDHPKFKESKRQAWEYLLI